MKRLRASQNADSEAWKGPPVAVLWDQSLVWGLICLETLGHLGVPFHLIRAKEIAGGGLDRHRVLVVPGGWASHKVRTLGEAGKIRIKQFVQNGGSYLGFCGGAGLALSSPLSLGLVPLQRMSLAERLPNASGEIWIQGATDHPLWEGLPPTLPVSIWWPSQFQLEPMPDSSCLATYRFPGSDFWVADLPLSDLNWRNRSMGGMGEDLRHQSGSGEAARPSRDHGDAGGERKGDLILSASGHSRRDMG